MFVVPGGNAVAAALAARWPLDRLLVAPPHDESNVWINRARQADVPVTLVDEAILSYLSDVPAAPEVLALARMPSATDGPLPATGLTLVLDGIGDPGNVGTLIRTADAAGAAAVVTSENSADPFGLKAVRSSAGSVFHLPPPAWEDRSPAALIARLQRENVPIVLATAHDGQSYSTFTWPARCALVLGHETRGVAAEWEAVAAARLTIPLRGRAESLNVAAAGAVLLFAWQASVR